MKELEMAEPEEVTQIAETYIHRETGVDRAVPWVRDGRHSHNLQGSTKPNKIQMKLIELCGSQVVAAGEIINQTWQRKL